MEIRRVQITGGSSFVMTLPKEWIKTSNIKKNDPLGIYLQSDGSLIITPKLTREQQQKTKEFSMTTFPKESYLLRQLIAAYIAGYTTIIITTKERLTSAHRMAIRKFTSLTIGQEIVEETDHSITLKDLLNPTEMPFDRTIKRMNIIVRGMHEDTLRAFEKHDTALIEEIIARDSEVDRLQWLIARQHNSILQNVSLAEKMYTTITLSSTHFLISRIIERIGDHVVKIATNINHLFDQKIDEKLHTYITQSSQQAMDIFGNALSAFFRKDLTASNKNIDSIETLATLCHEIDTYALNQPATIAVPLGYIIESSRRIGDYSTDISEHVINYLINNYK